MHMHDYKSALRPTPKGVRGPCAHSVPNLELDVLIVDGDHARPKLHANCEVVYRLEALVCELQQKA